MELFEALDTEQQQQDVRPPAAEHGRVHSEQVRRQYVEKGEQFAFVFVFVRFELESLQPFKTFNI